MDAEERKALETKLETEAAKRSDHAQDVVKMIDVDKLSPDADEKVIASTIGDFFKERPAFLRGESGNVGRGGITPEIKDRLERVKASTGIE